jgi:hypothetical protein
MLGTFLARELAARPRARLVRHVFTYFVAVQPTRGIRASSETVWRRR